MNHRYLLSGALGGFLAVGLSAFGAHALQDLLSERLMAVYQTATSFQMYHSLALVLVALLTASHPDSKSLHWSACFFLAGILLFSGSLYMLCLTGTHWLGAVTPIGGIAFMLGWLMLVLFAIRNHKSENY
ncbi:DUF423 domain-containing protein [Endozoicomonas sp. Mp262]|uniref:DUF423 domain-containing protein n=1 Tax=Endozoicomonas sp. Mp262 TaxID=2919499 RepID=UPI0021D8889A